MAHYVDGFVLPVQEDKLDVYLEMARESGKLWREHGALEFRECVADDVKVMEDPRLKELMDEESMPVDGKRMIYGGFSVAVEA